MSQQFDKELTGVLFKNDTEGKSENFPPYGGSAQIDGVDYWVSAWVKDGQKGKFFSLAFKRKEARQEPRAPAKQAAPAFEDDPLPF
jgi:hypothetical protein